MNYFVCFILITIFVANAVGWVAIGNYYSADNPGKCTFNDQLIISPGEKVDHPDMCAAVSCLDGEGNVEIAGCPAMAPPPNCKWGATIDENAPYPECCHKHLICDNVEDQVAWENMQNIRDPGQFLAVADINKEL